MTPRASDLHAMLARLVRRARWDGLIGDGLRAITALAVFSAALLVLNRVLALPSSRIAAAAAAVASAAVLVRALRRRPLRLLVARTADRRLGLAERLATAVQTEGAAPYGLGARLRDDAAAVAATIEPRRVYPWSRHRRAGACTALAVVLVLGVLLLPGQSAAAQAQLRQVRDHAAIDHAIAAVTKAERSAAAHKRAQPDSAGLRNRLQQALNDATAQLRKAQTPEQALAALSQLDQQLQGMDDLTLAARAVAAAAAGSTLAGDPALGRVGSALDAGQLGTAADALGTAAGSLSTASAATRQGLADKLGKAATAAGGDHPLSSALNSAAAALNSGDVAGAQKALGDAAAELHSLDTQGGAAADVAGARDAVGKEKAALGAQADADAVGGVGSSAGAGQQGSGSGAATAGPSPGAGGGTGGANGSGNSAGNGNGNGSGSGTGSGSGAGSGSGSQGGGGGQSNPVGPSDRLFVPGNPFQPFDDQLAPQLAPGAPVPTQDLKTVLDPFSAFALSTLDRGGLAPTDRDLVRSYFASLGGSAP
ncbi:MAG: hypothetical protein JF887_07805 [Candidatus Dormibacteraeota bacterium]|uniref:DUF4175 domain-containing protein n=1 Tax=Candidatus Amunia macphersoniae TaxID=3127014 RepID=A0A934N9R0_9BACT|nr:hypothetical protein [Candidatus Dormibacteraeota bacterium]